VSLEILHLGNFDNFQMEYELDVAFKKFHGHGILNEKLSLSLRFFFISSGSTSGWFLRCVSFATCQSLHLFPHSLANNFTKSVRIKEQQIIDKIWKPDTLFFNSKYSYFHLVSFPNFLMRIQPNGHITYTSR
jgi:hypothetical protein